MKAAAKRIMGVLPKIVPAFSKAPLQPHQSALFPMFRQPEIGVRRGPALHPAAPDAQWRHH
jgi:hypothetical protein